MEKRILHLRQLAIALILVVAFSWLLLAGIFQQNVKLSRQLFDMQVEAVKRQQGVFVPVDKFENRFEWKK